VLIMMQTEKRMLMRHSVVATGVAIALAGAVGADAQPFARTEYEAFPGWVINIYRSGETQAFLRCSAEERYGEQSALTIARSQAGYVVGFTSSRWTFEDGARHPATLRVDAGDPVTTSMRGRLLPSGPRGFTDFQPGDSVLTELPAGRRLAVRAVDVTLEYALEGVERAMASVERCFAEHAP
jgi:hypothetical protein